MKSGLQKWFVWDVIQNFKKKADKFGVISVMVKPTMWREPEKHPEDCYFCNTKVNPKKYNYELEMVEYVNVNSVTKPKYEGDLEEESVPMDVTVDDIEANIE